MSWAGILTIFNHVVSDISAHPLATMNFLVKFQYSPFKNEAISLKIKGISLMLAQKDNLIKVRKINPLGDVNVYTTLNRLSSLLVKKVRYWFPV